MKKPYTAVTVLIERLTGEEYAENDLGGVPDLIETIKLQDSGPTEASRAIRKKLKYGNVHRQLRALTLLDALIANAGRTFQRTFADEPLLERLRIAATSPTTDPDVKAKLKELFAQWAREYRDTMGLQGIASLHKQFPQRRKPVLKSDRTSAPPSPSASRSTPPPSGSPSRSTQATSSSDLSWKSHKKSRSKSKSVSFNLEKEKPMLNQTLANSSVSSTNLTNTLKLINREKERPSQKPEVAQQYENCKRLRHNLQRYIQHIESEQWLGSLIHSHEEISTTIQLYEEYDKPIEEDSDSDDEWNIVPALKKINISDDDTPPTMPPRPKGKVPEYEEEPGDEDDDPDNPFGNQYQIIEEEERPGMRWKVV